MDKLYDKNGREIMRGDIVKVFHFVAALRRKKHYMYKQALGIERGRMRFSHLDLDDEWYCEAADGRMLADYEIVDSIDAKFDERARIKGVPVSSH